MPTPIHNLSTDDARVRYYLAHARKARAEYIAGAVRRGFAGIVNLAHRLGHTINGSAQGARDGRAEA